MFHNRENFKNFGRNFVWRVVYSTGKTSSCNVDLLSAKDQYQRISYTVLLNSNNSAITEQSHPYNESDNNPSVLQFAEET